MVMALLKPFGSGAMWMRSINRRYWKCVVNVEGKAGIVDLRNSFDLFVWQLMRQDRRMIGSWKAMLEQTMVIWECER